MLAFATAQSLAAQDRYGEAFAIAQQVQSVLTGEEEFDALWDEIAVDIAPRTKQTGVTISFKPYDAPEADWTVVGQRELTPMAAPYGVLRLRLEKPGFTTREFAVANPGPMLGNAYANFQEYFDYPMPSLELFESGLIPDDMVMVPATDFPVFISGFTQSTGGDAQFAIPAFAIARNEVSNQQYKRFVDEGGYSNPAYWTGMKLADGSLLGMDTIQNFVDRSGRSGPATWELGTYLPGTADMPVGGISLYEAKAYARYRGLALPTLHHWARATMAPGESLLQTVPSISRASNFNAQQPVPVNNDSGVGPWGTLNAAGNVREWVWNRTDKLAFALGGSWSDYPTVAQEAYTLEPLSRDPKNGLRLMHNLGEPVEQALLEPVKMNWDSIHVKREPVSDDVFEAMRFQFTHVRRETKSVSVETVEENDTWLAQEVSLQFAAGQDMTLYVVRPTNHSGKTQAVVYMPHSGAFEKTANSLLLSHIPTLDFVIRAGRALIIPVWDLSAQRFQKWPEEGSAARADFMRRAALSWYEDAATTIDYLESRDDLDTTKIGFLGNSYGAYMSSIFLAIERRLSAAVLIAGGTPYWGAAHPMADTVNYLPRITMPVLMINGRYDHLFLYENSQKRMYELLGTAEEDKRHKVYDEGHFDFPRNQVALEVSDWFDKYLSTD